MQAALNLQTLTSLIALRLYKAGWEIEDIVVPDKDESGNLEVNFIIKDQDDKWRKADDIYGLFKFLAAHPNVHVDIELEDEHTWSIQMEKFEYESIVWTQTIKIDRDVYEPINLLVVEDLLEAVYTQKEESYQEEIERFWEKINGDSKV